MQTTLEIISAAVVEMNRRLKSLEQAFGIEREESIPELVRRLIAAICMAHGITQREMMGPCRQQDLVWPRHLAMFLCNQKLGMGASAVGRLFQCDPSNVRHAVRQTRDRIATEPKRAKELAQWIAHLQQTQGGPQ